MRVIITGAAGLVLAACQGTEAPEAANTEPTEQADSSLTMFSGGTIYTGIGTETVEAVTVNDSGRIVAVGASASQDRDESKVNLIDLDGAVMFPGFADGHAHLLGIGQREITLSLEGTASVAELVTRIESELQGVAPGQVLGGRGWIETGWPEGRMPSAADLDAVSPDNPVILTRADGHALVANSAALAAAGIDDDTPDVEGGKIERDADGKATGILIDNAMGQALALIATPSEQDIIRAYVVGAAAYSSRGWTGVHNMSVNPAHAPVMERLDLEGRMPLRLHNAYDQEGFALATNRDHETETITNRSVKLYMDGALGSRGALLIEPYSDRPGTSGLSLMEPELLFAAMEQADQSNVQLAIHAIGDLANRRILDTFEQGAYGADNRWRIEHTQILHPDDIGRVNALGLIASMQPSHAIGDLKFAPDRLGPNRLYGAYAWSSLLETDAIIVGGSDAPVEVGTPQIEFYAAVARKDLEGFSTEQWNPEQALTREQALTLFTSAPAYAGFMEDDLGTIEVGKLADFTVFDRDIMTIPEAEILEARTVMTVVHGEIVFDVD
ncbi:MAG: amidohydrolase [Pseudomonadota bacterium]